MISADGWLQEAVRCPSPNFNRRPDGMPIELLVIHNISLPPGEFGGGWVQRFFQNNLDPNSHPYFSAIAEMQVSAHLFIERNGGVTQFVSFLNRAWHAGVSRYGERDNCNDFSVGIELEGTDELAYTAQQYKVLADVTQQLLAAYPSLSSANITGHSDIAPGRKTDPGPAFDWVLYRQMLDSM